MIYLQDHCTNTKRCRWSLLRMFGTLEDGSRHGDTEPLGIPMGFRACSNLPREDDM